MRQTTATITRRGAIKHAMWRGLLLPVKLRFHPQTDFDDDQPPLMRRGKPVYVLPGGKEWQP